MDSSSIQVILSALAWPIVVLAALIIFRHPLREAIGKVLKLKIKAGKFEFESIKSNYSEQMLDQMKQYVSSSILESLKNHPDKLGSQFLGQIFSHIMN